MKIVVLAGGLSPERDVSLSSGSLIANALLENGHQIMLADLYLGAKNPDFPLTYKKGTATKKYHYSVPEKEPNLDALKKFAQNGECLIGSGIMENCLKADVVFLALHGSIGENGQLQAVFDTQGIRYTGTGYIGSLLAMDKDISKQLIRAAGILTPDWILVSPKSLDTRALNIKYPCVIKPCSCGSSVGVTLADNSNQLETAIRYAGEYEKSVMIEDKIEGREFSVGVLNGEALPPIEIIPNAGFYDYKNKYQAGLTKEICPADISEPVDCTLRSAALAVHKALRLGSYSRIDFILDQENRAFCLEANTLPGMTPTSLLPQEARAAGISYNRLCDQIAFSS